VKLAHMCYLTKKQEASQAGQTTAGYMCTFHVTTNR
jgi:hypothetical protein